MLEPKIRINIFKDSLWELKTIVSFVLEIGTGKSEYIINDYSITNPFPILGSTSIIGFDNSFDYSGDFILTARVGTNAGEIYKYSGEAKITDNTVYIKSNCLDCLYYSLLHYNLKRLSFGTGQPLIKTSELKKIKIFFPSSIEQSAIGSLFRTLDDLLASYNDNLANYQSLKVTMLSKMFPKAGQTVPEIRLDGFEGEWEKGTIGEFGSFYYGKSAPKWSVTDEATTPCVRYGELYTKFSTKIDKIYSYTSIPKENLKLSSGNEVLVPRVGEDPLDFANCSWLSLKGVAIGEMISVYNTPNNPLFIAYYFNAKMKKEFAKRVEGGSVANLYYTYLENILISVPSLPEQQAIGAYFSNLDNLISSHQEKISQLEILKKKLLQDMFI
ncbi:restriction endonuclease subunit S [Streptococcus mitis]|jgi:lin0525 protein|uniref:restriction endonuclease subunit S n=1 Tax=Streptococcus mitis TaxID=28037 RepID=UPI0022B797F1|nr:restriction endonuclease subunit S [Streptococcus mitis]